MLALGSGLATNSGLGYLDPASQFNYNQMMARQSKASAAEAQLTQMEKDIQTKTTARETEVRGLYDQIIGMYGPGGTYGQGVLADLARQKTRDMASATQSLVSSGMFGSTMTAGLGKKWEEEIGVPSRAKLEDVRYGQLSQAIGQKAQFVTGIEQQMPDYAMLGQLMKSAYGGA